MTTALFTCRQPVTRDCLFKRLDETLSPSFARKLRSLVGRSLDAAGVGTDPAEDMRITLSNLHHLATTRAVHADAPAACRKVFTLATGRRGKEPLVVVRGGTLLSDQWLELLTFAESDTKRRAHSRLLALARVVHALGGGRLAPAVLPSSAELMKSGPLIGLSEKTVRMSIRTYRRLRLLAVTADPESAKRYAPLDDNRRIRGRNVLSVLAASGPCQHRSALDAIADVAPVLHAQLLKYKTSPMVKGKLHVPSTVAANIEAFSRLVGALLVHAPELLPIFSCKHLWNLTRPLESSDDEKEVWDEDTSTTSDVPLARWIIAKTAPQIRARCAPGVGTGYPTMVVSDLKAWFSVTEWAHGFKMRDNQSVEWECWRARYGALRQHVRERTIPAELLLRSKDKERIVNTYTMSHMWCVDLPVLAMESERLLQRLEAEIAAVRSARPSEDPMKTAVVMRALAAFEASAEGTLATSLVFYDGMRCAQYRCGRWGQHIRPDIDAKTGEWFGVKTRWYGHRLDEARVKQGTSRARQLGPAHLPMRVLRAYIDYVRAPRLMAAGVHVEDAHEANGRFPLFVSTVGKKPSPFSKEHFRNAIVGPVLYRIATQFHGCSFGDANTYEQVNRSDFFGVLGVHVSRYVIATGCARILDNLALGVMLTGDDPETLEASYIVNTWLPEGREGTWQNAKSYVPWLLRLVEDGALDNPLDTMPPALIPPGVAALMSGWSNEDRLTQIRMKRGVYGSPSGRLRRSRPDVAARNRARAAAGAISAGR